MTVADLIVARLRDAGVRTLFGVPGGGSNLDVIDFRSRLVAFIIRWRVSGFERLRSQHSSAYRLSPLAPKHVKPIDLFASLAW